MDFTALIEIPAGGNTKYEVDEETGHLHVDRFLKTSFVYPFNYGSIQKTDSEDRDPLDVIVLSSSPVQPGVTMKCHAIGVLTMEDEGGKDKKIIAVPDAKVDPEFGKIRKIKGVSKATLDKIRHFFENYKELEEGKWVKIGKFRGVDDANRVIEECYARAEKHAKAK